MPTVTPERLKEVVIEVLKGLGASEDEAPLVAESLVRAEMRGTDTHGLPYLKLLVERIEARMVSVPTRVTVLKDEGATALLDGGNGIGQVAGWKAMEISLMNATSQEAAARLATAWRGDRSPHQLKLPGGLVEVRMEDEGGKINLNQVNEQPLAALLSALNVSPSQIPVMVDSLLDWRSKSDRPRPNGAKSSYYLGLEPPYVSRNGPFEVVEELAWVRGFEGSPMIPRLGEWLTAQPRVSETRFVAHIRLPHPFRIKADGRTSRGLRVKRSAPRHRPSGVTGGSCVVPRQRCIRIAACPELGCRRVSY